MSDSSASEDPTKTMPSTAGERFTPGPWDIGMTSNNANANIIYKRIPEERFGDKAITSVYGLPINTPLDEMGRWADGEDMANARLISAAPDLYGALSELLTAFINAVGPSSQHIPEERRAVDKARAALAKASPAKPSQD